MIRSAEARSASAFQVKVNSIKFASRGSQETKMQTESHQSISRTRRFALVMSLAGSFAGHLQGQTLSGPTYSEWRISPASITVVQGSYSGSLSALNTKDQTGTQNTAANYVQFGTAAGQLFTGYMSFTVPAGVTLSQITSIQLMANVLAPQDT